MKTLNYINKFKVVIVALFALVPLFAASHVFAMTPTVAFANQGTTSIAMSVYGDPNSNVTLSFYTSFGQQSVGNLGYTNSSGYFSTTLNASAYTIGNGAQVFVTVNGQQSPSVTWPYTSYNTAYNSYSNYSNYSNLYTNYNTYPYANNTASVVSFSQNNITLTSGQSSSVSIYGNSGNVNNYYIASNSNPNAVSATINGSMISLYAYGSQGGSSTLSVCSQNSYYGNSSYYGNNYGCGTLYVTVTASYYNNNSYTYPYTYNNYHQYSQGQCNQYPQYQTQSYQYPYQQTYPYQNQNQCCPGMYNYQYIQPYTQPYQQQYYQY